MRVKLSHPYRRTERDEAGNPTSVTEHQPGEEIDVPDDEGRKLLKSHATPVGEGDTGSDLSTARTGRRSTAATTQVVGPSTPPPE